MSLNQTLFRIQNNTNVGVTYMNLNIIFKFIKCKPICICINICIINMCVYNLCV